MTVEEWKTAYVEYFRDKDLAELLAKSEPMGRVWWNILTRRGEPVARDAYFGAEHPAVIALNDLREQNVLVTSTNLISGHIEVTTKAVADKMWPKVRK